MIKLYQFPLSHFCEKARWALERKKIPFKIKNLLPGLHIKPMKKKAGASHLPVLTDGKVVVQGSSAIIDYLDATYPRFGVTPENEQLREQAKHWEAMCDEKIGPSVRVLAYSILLEERELLIPMFTSGSPFYAPFIMNKIFPKVRAALKKHLPVNDESVAAAKAQLREAINEIKAGVEQNGYLVGGSFSRADIGAASLLSPLFMPPGYGGPKPANTPQKFKEMAEQFNDIEGWVCEVYERHRLS